MRHVCDVCAMKTVPWIHETAYPNVRRAFYLLFAFMCTAQVPRAVRAGLFPRSCDPCSRKIREPASFILHGSARTSTARHSFACTCLFVLLTYLSIREKLAHACMDTRSSSDHGAAAAWRALLTMVLQPIHWSARHARPTTHNPATQFTARRPPA